jgi:hypothetical protein
MDSAVTQPASSGYSKSAQEIDDQLIWHGIRPAAF